MTSLATARQQRGLTFANFLLIGILLIFLAIFGMRIVPAYVENRTIQHILDTIAHDPDLQDAQPSDLRNSWDKRAMINNITVVNAQDLQVQKVNGNWVLGVSYNVKISLVGNASLLLEFNNSSAHQR